MMITMIFFYCKLSLLSDAGKSKEKRPTESALLKSSVSVFSQGEVREDGVFDFLIKRYTSSLDRGYAPRK